MSGLRAAGGEAGAGGWGGAWDSSGPAHVGAYPKKTLLGSFLQGIPTGVSILIHAFNSWLGRCKGRQRRAVDRPDAVQTLFARASPVRGLLSLQPKLKLFLGSPANLTLNSITLNPKP